MAKFVSPDYTEHGLVPDYRPGGYYDLNASIPVGIHGNNDTELGIAGSLGVFIALV
jgi:hypothetical protein